MKAPALIAVALLVTACGGRTEREPVTPVTQIPETGGWFCQMSASGNGWECVQDPSLAESPQPERLPSPPDTREPDAVDSPPTETPGRQEPRPGPLAEPAGPVEPQPDPLVEPTGPIEPQPGPLADPAAPVQPQPEPVADPLEAPSPRTEAEPSASAPPDYVGLAYQPDSPVALTDLPGDLYAVQLIALSSKSDLEAYVERNRLEGVSAARVERDGKLYYVVLLGVYETVERARRAVDSLPQRLNGSRPWIRPLASLHSAMRRADRLAGTAMLEG